MPTDDELARTAPAPAAAVGVTATAAGAAVADASAPSSLGRFEIVGVLGAGGMGVVHDARDPELDRRVALKVLHAAAGTDESRARLLREARAMAKLSHRNVITVYEVGGAQGRDYVAMELIDGGDLAEWLDGRPTMREILVAFIAAGRGLAAAHAAGLVHRDFKPKNVLRRRDGQVVVTDFGLAQEGAVATGMGASSASTASLAATMTGALVGTPAYMPPEQWRGEQVTPASDQFAFAVALWEALAGHRPFTGDTLDAVRDAILAGPAQLHAAELPRPLRALLLRALALDPAKRWPSMEALLARLERVVHRPRRMLALGAAAIAVAAIAVAVVILPGRDPAAIAAGGCGAPPLAVEAIGVRVHDRPNLAAALARWSEVRTQACAAQSPLQTQRAACLDGVLARIGDVAAGSDDDGDALLEELVDPTLCLRSPPPALLGSIDSDLAAAFASDRSQALKRPTGDLTRLLASPAPCTRAIALSATTDTGSARDAQSYAAAVHDLDALRAAADLCGDDAIRAAGKVAAADGTPTELPAARAAVEGFPSSALRAALEQIEADVDMAAGRFDDSLAHLDRALAGYGDLHAVRNQLAVAEHQAIVRLERGTAADLAAVMAMPARWPSAATIAPRQARELARRAAVARWRSGDVTGGDAVAAPKLLSDLPPQVEAALGSAAPWMAISGEVVDEAGAPVANAEVVSALGFQSDSEHVQSPNLSYTEAVTTTDARGTFAFPRGHGFVAAGLGALRSTPVAAAPTLHLVVHPTSRIEGTATLHGAVPGQVYVIVRPRASLALQLFAPVAASGTFVIDGVPRGDVEIGVAPVNALWAATKPWGDPAFQKLAVTGARVRGVTLAYGDRQLTVIARSATDSVIESAYVYMFAGKQAFDHLTMRDVQKRQDTQLTQMAIAVAAGDAATPPIAADDLVARFPSRADGDATVCAVAFSRHMLASAGTQDKIQSAILDAELGCATVGPSDTTVTIEVPAIRRIR